MRSFNRWLHSLLGLAMFCLCVAAPQSHIDATAIRSPISKNNVSRLVELKRLGSGSVYGIAWSRDGKRLFANGSLGIWVYDNSTFQLQTLFPARSLKSSGILGLTASPDGHWLASPALTPNAAIVWDANSGQIVRTLQSPISPGRVPVTFEVAFSPDSKKLFMSSLDGYALLWNVAAGQLLRHVDTSGQSIYALTFSPNGQYFAAASGDKTIRVWSAETGKQIVSLLQSDSVNSLAFSPDSALLASANRDHSIKLWNVAQGKVIQTLLGHTDSVVQVVFDTNGKRLVSGSADKTVRTWEVATGKLLATIPIDISIQRMALNSQDQLAILDVAAGELELWNLTAGKREYKIDGFTSWVWSVAFSADNVTVAAGGFDHTVTLWDSSMGTIKGHLAKSDNFDISVALSPDGKTLLISDSTEQLRLWDYSTDHLLRILKGHTAPVHSVAYSPDGSLAVSGGDDKTVRVWRVTDGQLLHTFEASDRVFKVAFGNNGWIAATSLDGVLHVWNAVTYESVLTWKGGKHWQDVAFSPDGQFMAIGWQDNAIRILDATTFRNLCIGFTERTDSMAFSPDGKLLATGQDGSIRIWDVATCQPLRVLQGHVGDVEDLTFSSDGALIASGGSDGTVRIWGLAS